MQRVRYAPEQVAEALARVAAGAEQVDEALAREQVPVKVFEVADRIGRDSAHKVVEYQGAEGVPDATPAELVKAAVEIGFLRGVHFGLELEKMREGEIAFMCAGAAIGVAMEDHPDYTMPSERVSRVVNELLVEEGVRPAPEEVATNGESSPNGVIS